MGKTGRGRHRPSTVLQRGSLWGHIGAMVTVVVVVHSGKSTPQSRASRLKLEVIIEFFILLKIWLATWWDIVVNIFSNFCDLRRNKIKATMLLLLQVAGYSSMGTHLRATERHLPYHSVICRPTEMNATGLNPSQPGWYLIHLSQTDERLSWPWWLVTYRDGLPDCRQSPIQVVTTW